MASDEPQSITLESIQTHLQSYPSQIPPKLRALDVLRLEEIPAKLAQRKKDGDAFLEKNEVTSLVEWKLKHGTFRPNLANLVASNSDSDILSTTKSAFATYEADNDAYADSIKALSKLKGIGPATASLLLSCYDPVRIPFFSDQLFRYALWERVAGRGWDRKIKYSMKEYTEMYEKVQALRERLENGGGQEVSALALEKTAYVLGKEAQLDSKRYDVQEAKREENDEPRLSSKRSKKRKDAITGDNKTEEKLEQQPPTKKRKKDINEDVKQHGKCLRKRPNGFPTYDTLGYELDYEYINSVRDPPSRDDDRSKKASKHIEEIQKNKERKKSTVGSGMGSEDAWDEKVARDSRITIHEVGIEEYEEWKKRGVEPQFWRDCQHE